MDRKQLEKDLQSQIDAGTLDLAGVERLLGVAGDYVDTDATLASVVYRSLIDCYPVENSAIVQERSYYNHNDQYSFKTAFGPIYLVFPPYLSDQYDSEIVWHPEFKPARKPEVFERLKATLSPRLCKILAEGIAKSEICVTSFILCTSLYFSDEQKFRSAMNDNGFGHHTDRILQGMAEILKTDLS